MTKQKHAGHQWRFFRAGGIDQVRLDRGDDFVNLPTLDRKLWVALACPSSGLHVDTRTLAKIDADGDKKVRAPKLTAAVQWTCNMLKDPSRLLESASTLPLDAIDERNEEGAALVACAREALASLKKPEDANISIEDIGKAATAFAQRPFNGDGIICANATDKPEIIRLIEDIGACVGTAVDASGKDGITRDAATTFFADAAAYVEWWEGRGAEPEILTLGEQTDAAYDALEAVRARVDDYFARCRMAAFDSRAAEALNRSQSDFEALAKLALSRSSAELEDFPLAACAPGAALSLDGPVNPAWTEQLTVFRDTVMRPIIGQGAALSEQQWDTILERFAAHRAWRGSRAGEEVAPLGIARVRDALAIGMTPLESLFKKEMAQEGAAARLSALENLILYYRDLYRLCTNFVNFRNFYDPEDPALFQVGQLYIDQRRCDLCIRVDDPAKHATMAGLAGAYLAYCDCERKSTGEKLQIVAVVTDGESDNLMVGRNGVFFDHLGRDWDATITRIVDNPISLRQAFWSPYKKFVRMIEEQIAKRAAAADTTATDKLQGAAAATAAADKNKAALAPKKVDVGTVAALGVAFGAIGTFFATVLGYAMGVVKLGPIAIAGALLGVIALISGPSMILAFIKLRKRNLGPILDAGGWAINAKAHISVPYGARLTQLAKLPPGSQRDIRDPYAEKSSPWPRLIVVAFVLYVAWTVLNHMGLVNTWSGGRVGKAAPVEAIETAK